MSPRCRLCAVLIAAFSLVACQGQTAGSAAASERQVIGRSLEGRPIVSVRSGSRDPAVKLLVVGSIHGDERAGMGIARLLIALGAPRGAELLVVPTLNPDGVAAGTRGNARGVDLNRNFPFGWRPLSGGEYSGPKSLSEPESRAAHSLILEERPDVTLWFHQPFGLIDRPDGNPFVARRFAELIGFPMIRLPGPYPGSVSRWQNHRFPRSTAFVAELPAQVNGRFITRGVTSIYKLTSELASPTLTPAAQLSGR